MRQSFRREARRIGPELDRLVARNGARHQRGIAAREITRDAGDDFFRRSTGEPLQRARQPAHHGLHGRALGGDDISAGIEGRIGSGAAAGLRIPDMACAAGFHLAHQRLKKLRDIKRTGCNSGGIGGHRLIRDPLDRSRIDSRLTDIILQGPPRGGHFAHRTKRHARQIAQLEARIGRAPDQKEGITHHHRTEQAQGAGRIGIMRQQQPHRPTPGQIRRAIQYGILRKRRHCAGEQRDLHPLHRVIAARQGRVEWCVE